MGVKCPICGDPNGYPLWVDKTPPAGCPEDRQWHGGGEISIHNVTECPYQMRKAAQRAKWMKLVPDAFDASGQMKPGQIGRVLEAYAKAYPDVGLII